MMIRPLTCAALLLAASPLLANDPVASGTEQAAPVRMDHISVVAMGQGSPVILIPGLSTPRAVWDDFVPALARDHRVYLVQVNGFGGDDPGANLAPGVFDGIVADLAGLIAREKMQAPAVVGHSMGGLAGMLLAARHPQSVGRLMIVDSLPFFSVTMVPPGTPVSPASAEPFARRFRDQIVAGYGQPANPAMVEANVAGLALQPESRERIRAWVGAADARVTGQAVYEDMTIDAGPLLPGIAAPVTVVYATNAARMAPAQTEAFYRGQYAPLPGAAFVAVPDSGHFVMLDQPAAFTAALNDFLK